MTLTDSDIERFARQLVLPELNEEGQEKLQAAHLVLVGLGGLGAPVLAYLVGAGVGKLTLIDSDIVDLSNLQRQFIYEMTDIGSPKTQAAARFAKARNPAVEIISIAERLDETNAKRLITGADLVIDASDLLETRLILAAAAKAQGIGHLFGGAVRYDGQLCLFTPHLDAEAPCFGCLFDAAPDPDQAPNCQQAGILGPVVGMIGCLMAGEALKYITAIGDEPASSLLLYDGLSNRFETIKFGRKPDCLICGPQN